VLSCSRLKSATYREPKKGEKEMKAQDTRETVARLVGKTPILEVTRLKSCLASCARVFAKLDFLNPSGSIKDVMALHMIREAERAGLIGAREGQNKKIVEATSGNTGISFAMLAAARGYEFTAVMPESASVERRALMRQYGAKIILTKKPDCKEAVAVAKRIAARENAWFPAQYENEANARAHEKITGAEIVSQMRAIAPDDEISAFVAGVGTGGTLIGVARALRAINPRVRIVAVEPDESPTITNGAVGKHGIQGISVGFIPEIYSKNAALVDEVARVTTRDAIERAKELAAREGLAVGISSGANVEAALRVAGKLSEGVVVTVLPDSSDRYYSTELFHQEDE
jgi:cysteine synthase A